MSDAADRLLSCIESMKAGAVELGYPWQDPIVVKNASGGYSAEWWNDHNYLTVHVGESKKAEAVLTQVIGPTCTREYAVTDVGESRRLWLWLMGWTP